MNTEHSGPLRHNPKWNDMLETLVNDRLKLAVLSNPIQKDATVKVKIRPVMIKGKMSYQAEEYTRTQAFHRNMAQEEAKAYMTRRMEQDFRQCEVNSLLGSGHVLISQKGRATIKFRKNPDALEQVGSKSASASKTVNSVGLNLEEPVWLSHNRKKRYLLEEGKPVPFLKNLGVMTADGTIVRAKYDKYRQINRFLELVEDVLPSLKKEKENLIIDFGCGKSYLTFAMYHYLHVQNNYPVRIVGLDLKKDVVARCNRLAKSYGYHKLNFLHGDIASYEGAGTVDMVVTLHACDLATDYALAKAVKWNASVILSVPCCQHELNRQIQNRTLDPVLGYGLLKDRMAALLTDGLRAQVLEHYGYRTQILEFIDMEHTPKNLLIRGVRQGKPRHNGSQIREMTDFFQADPAILRLLPLREE